MTHYVCRGSCQGVTDHPRNCGDQNCELYNEPLEPCECTDGAHSAEE